MGQKDFNRDMGSYLRSRDSSKGSGFLKKGLFSAKIKIVDEEKEKPAEDIPLEQVQAVMRGESVEPTTEDLATELYEEPQRERISVWKRVTTWFTFSDDGKEELLDDNPNMLVVEERVPKVDGDVKEMLRTCVQWVNMLPPEKIQEIRRSDDYRKFKHMLEKYELIKK